MVHLEEEKGVGMDSSGAQRQLVGRSSSQSGVFPTMFDSTLFMNRPVSRISFLLDACWSVLKAMNNSGELRDQTCPERPTFATDWSAVTSDRADAMLIVIIPPRYLEALSCHVFMYFKWLFNPSLLPYAYRWFSSTKLS